MSHSLQYECMYIVAAYGLDWSRSRGASAAGTGAPAAPPVPPLLLLLLLVLVVLLLPAMEVATVAVALSPMRCTGGGTYWIVS